MKLKNKQTKAEVSTEKVIEKRSSSDFVFTKDNYKWLLGGCVILLIGFLLMIGGGSDDPAVFSEAIFNFQRMTLSPLLILTGYGVVMYSIVKKSVD